jgi:Family of unknown function (DUF6012)
MLLHITPNIYSHSHAARLLALDIEQLNLHLKDGTELRTGRPYPNKNYWVACRKMGHKNFQGILIETPRIKKKFDYTARWLIGPSFVATHRIQYKLLDRNFDALSDNIGLWSATCKELGDWVSRVPDWAKQFSPMQASPRMEVMPTGCRPRVLVEDIQNEQTGWIVLRQETFLMPSIERGRIEDRMIEGRLPPVSMAFRL